MQHVVVPIIVDLQAAAHRRLRLVLGGLYVGARRGATRVVSGVNGQSGRSINCRQSHLCRGAEQHSRPDRLILPTIE